MSSGQEAFGALLVFLMHLRVLLYDYDMYIIKMTEN